MDHGSLHVCVGSRTKVHSRCLLFASLLLVTVLVCPAFSQTRLVSLSTQFDGFLQTEFFDLNGVVLNGQTLSIDFKFENGSILESIAPVWAELVLQTRPHGPDGDYPYDQYIVFEPGTTAHLLGSFGEKLDVPMSDWNGALTGSPGLTLPVLATPRGLAGGDMLAYPSPGQEVVGIHYDVVLPNTGETIYLGRIGLRLETRYRRIPITISETLPPDPPPVPAPPPVPEPDPPPPPPPPVPDPTPPPDVVVNPPSDPSATGFAVADLGMASFTTRRSGVLVAGYGRIQPAAGFTSPSGMLILGSRLEGYLTSETIVADSPLISSGRMYMELTPDGRVTTGIAITNPNSEDATVNFELRNDQGNIYRIGGLTLKGGSVACVSSPDCNQLSRWLDDAPFFAGRDVQGTLSFTSTAPVSVYGIRFTSSGGGNYLMTSVPVTDLSMSPSYGTQVVPLFAAGEGRRSELILVNPTGTTLTGSVRFMDPGGISVFVASERGYIWNVDYFIPPNGSQKLVVADVLGGFAYGSVKVFPDAGGPAPSASVIHNYSQSGILTFEVGVPVTMGTAFRMAAEQSPGQIYTTPAIANPSSSGGNVWISLTDSSGNFIASTSRYLPGSGLILESLDSLFPALAAQQVQGVLRVTTDLPEGISVSGFRGRYNELQQFLNTTLPVVLETDFSGSGERFFPYLLNGSGVAMDIVLFGGKAGQNSVGTLRFVGTDATPLNVEIQSTTPR